MHGKVATCSTIIQGNPRPQSQIRRYLQNWSAVRKISPPGSEKNQINSSLLRQHYWTGDVLQFHIVSSVPLHVVWFPLAIVLSLRLSKFRRIDLLWHIVSRSVVIWMRLEEMNRCIVSRLLDHFLLASINPEPCACLQLARACLSTSAWSSTLPLWSSRLSWIQIEFAKFANLTSQSALVSAYARISSVRQQMSLTFPDLTAWREKWHQLTGVKTLKTKPVIEEQSSWHPHEASQ